MAQNQNRDKELPLGEHLEELRDRIIRSVLLIIVLGIAAYIFRTRLLNYLMQLSPSTSMIYIHPTEAFLTYLKLAGLTGIVLSTPWVLYQVWQFILPALLENEEKYMRYGFFFGGISFYVGVALSLLFGIPISLQMLADVGSGSAEMQLSIRNYISFVSLLCFAVGLVFEVPLVIFIFVKLGLISVETLRKNRKYAILISFTVAAFLTPTDFFSQAFMAIPLVLLYEITTLLVSILPIETKDRS